MIEDFFPKPYGITPNFLFMMKEQKWVKILHILKPPLNTLHIGKNEFILTMMIFVYQVKITEKEMLCKHHIEYE